MTTYTEVFGGSTLYPSTASYYALNISADTTLTWPLETISDANLATAIVDVSATVNGLKVYLPSAQLASLGQPVLINNVGTHSFTVVDFTGGTICVPASGEVWQVYVTDNTTDAGAWQVLQYGAGVSSANAASLAGYGLQAISTTLNQSMPVTNFNSNYTAGVPDRATTFLWTGGVGYLYFTDPGTVGANWFASVRNQGTGTLYLTPPGTSLIDGGASKNIAPTESCTVFCDGTNYYTLGFGQNANFAFNYIQITLPSTGVATYTLSTAQQNEIAYKFTGALTGNIKVVIPPTIQQYWVDNSTTGSYTLTVGTASGTGYIVAQNTRSILYCNGTDTVNATSAGISVPVLISQGGTSATTASGARINLGGTTVGIGVFTAASTTDAQTAMDVYSTSQTNDIAAALAVSLG